MTCQRFSRACYPLPAVIIPNYLITNIINNNNSDINNNNNNDNNNNNNKNNNINTINNCPAFGAAS